MNYWLLKTEPGTYSWEDLVKDGSTFWDGVRNYQARNNFREMKKGDLAFIYHSVNEKRVMGIAKISKESYQDPSTDDDRWLCVDIQPVEPLKRTVDLAEIKGNSDLSEMVLVKNSRLSVQPVKREEFDKIIELSRK